MFELLDWWNMKATEISPVLSSAILHYQFEHIHPCADGNGRTGRALGLWEFYWRGFDSHHIFSVDEYFREDRPDSQPRLQPWRGSRLRKRLADSLLVMRMAFASQRILPPARKAMLPRWLASLRGPA